MTPSHRLAPHPLSFAVPALLALLTGCAELVPDATDRAPTETPVTVAPATAAALEDPTVGTRVDAPGARRESPLALPVDPRTCGLLALSDPRNAQDRGTRFELPDLPVAGVTHRTACAGTGTRQAANLALGFTAPTAGRWRLSVDGGYSWERWNLSVVDGCAEEGALLRCLPYARAVLVTLAAGQTVTLVADGIPGGHRCTVRAERVDPSSVAPEVRSARVYRWLHGGFAVIETSASDTESGVLVVELRDARGALVPFGGVPRRESAWWASGGTRLDLGVVPEEAVRARVWAEDATGTTSEVREVPLEPRPVVSLGQPCRDDGSFSNVLTTCEPSTLCIYERSTGRHCRARLEARFDAAAGALRVDLNAANLGMTAAQVAFVDAAGRELERTERFPWTGNSTAYALERSALLARDRWTPPAGFSRVRVTVLDSEGRRVTTLEAPVDGPERADRWWRCDPATTARVRCADGLVCVATAGNSDFRTCQRRDPGCPAAWDGRRWAPAMDTGAASLEAVAASEHWTFPECFSGAAWSGTSVREDVLDFIAPVSGRFRFRLVRRSPEESRRGDFGLAALRRECRTNRAAAPIACGRATWDSTLGTFAAIDVTATAGEHLPLVVSSYETMFPYRLEVTLAERSP